MAEGKAKKANTEAPMQTSSGSLEMGTEKRTAKEAKKAGKGITGAEDPLMNHQAKTLAEAVGLKKVRCNSKGKNNRS